MLSGTRGDLKSLDPSHSSVGKIDMNGIIYIIGLVVVIAAVLSFFGLR